MNILVTGGAGYIGSVLVGFLLNAGHKVTVIDNLMYGQNSLNHYCHEQNFQGVSGDVRDMGLVQPFLKSSDVIIPLAAFVGAPLCSKDPLGARLVNYTSVMDILNAVSNSQVVLMPTTNSAYGTGDNNNFCDETSELRPISQYAREKVEVEKKLLEFPNSISFRLATVFGMSPRMRIDLLVNDFVHRAVTDGCIVLFESHFKRNYIHVRDVARVFLHALENFSRMRQEIFNVGLSSANLSKKELCEAIALQVSNFNFIESNVGKDPDQRNYIVSNKKLESTGFEPNYNIDTGIAELIKGYKLLPKKQFSNI